MYKRMHTVFIFLGLRYFTQGDFFFSSSTHSPESGQVWPLGITGRESEVEFVSSTITQNFYKHIKRET